MREVFAETSISYLKKQGCSTKECLNIGLLCKALKVGDVRSAQLLKFGRHSARNTNSNGTPNSKQ